MSASSTLKRQQIAIVGDAEQALRRLGDWRDIDAQADVTVHATPLRGEALVAALVDADAVVLVRDRTPFDAALLQQLPKLRYLIFTGTRNTTLELAALEARNIPVKFTMMYC